MNVPRSQAGVDDSAFCHKVSLALSKGWELSGSPAYAFDAKEGVMAFLEKRPAQFANKVSSDMPAFFPWWAPRAYE